MRSMRDSNLCGGFVLLTREESLPLENFENTGFGWVCVACSKKEKSSAARTSRLMTEGEAESKDPELTETAMASWTDASKSELECQRCGIRESVRD